MKRPPRSPQAREAALDRALEMASVPVAPHGLTARIVQEATRHGQLPPLEFAPEPGQVAGSAAALCVGETVLPPVRAARRAPSLRWIVGGATGFAAMAAGIAAMLVVDPDSATAPPAGLAATRAPGGAAASLVASAQNAAVNPGMDKGLHTPDAAARLASATRDGDARPTVGEPAESTVLPAEPVAVPPLEDVRQAEQPEALAAVASPSVAPGPEDMAGPPALGGRGTMGPTLQQGYGYAGGMGLPSGAPVSMSGGPGGPPHR